MERLQGHEGQPDQGETYMTTFGEFAANSQEQDPIIRYTSPTVLTIGVEQGWADPVDPRAVDFSRRQSFVGTLAFDAEGRPLNPYRRSDHIGDRGELGKWGVNNAADPVAIAIDTAGNRKILMIRRNDDGVWALPGGMVDAGETATVAAKRELLEEAGVDLATVTSEVIYEGYVPADRNTQNAWIETSGVLLLIDHLPQPHSAPGETLDAQWFALTSVAALVEALGSISSGHEHIIQAAIDRMEPPGQVVRQVGAIATAKAG